MNHIEVTNLLRSKYNNNTILFTKTDDASDYVLRYYERWYRYITVDSSDFTIKSWYNHFDTIFKDEKELIDFLKNVVDVNKIDPEYQNLKKYYILDRMKNISRYCELLETSHRSKMFIDSDGNVHYRKDVFRTKNALIKALEKNSMLEEDSCKENIIDFKNEIESYNKRIKYYEKKLIELKNSKNQYLESLNAI